jgi:apolipoprotein D and lipocalin family protein
MNRLSRFLVLAFVLTACSDGPMPRLAEYVDLDRYAGRWYVISEIPYFAERGNVGSSFDIAFGADGTLTDVYTGYPKTFDAKPTIATLTGYVVPNTGNAKWMERPFWPLSLPYLILYVDPDYRFALVGYPGLKYGWVLARDPVMDEATYRALLARFAEQGYDIGQFERVPQRPLTVPAEGSAPYRK